MRTLFNLIHHFFLNFVLIFFVGGGQGALFLFYLLTFVIFFFVTFVRTFLLGSWVEGVGGLMLNLNDLRN